MCEWYNITIKGICKDDGTYNPCGSRHGIYCRMPSSEEFGYVMEHPRHFCPRFEELQMQMEWSRNDDK